MVKPDRAPARMARLGLILGLGAAATGCALVPRSRLDDATKVTQALRAENAQHQICRGQDPCLCVVLG